MHITNTVAYVRNYTDFKSTKNVITFEPLVRILKSLVFCKA